MLRHMVWPWRRMNRGKMRLRLLRFAALSVALIALLPLAIGATFWHTDSPGTEATCPICHVAHMPVLPGIVAHAEVTPKVVAWVILAEASVSHCAPAGLDSPPRGPPAA
jgi:hypothetical protein